MKKLRRRPNRFPGLSVGLDLHQQFMQFSVLDEAGDEIRQGRLVSQAQALEKLMDELGAKDRCVQVSLEASGCFMWVYDLLIQKLDREQVHVAAPSKVRVIANSMEKNDANDAWWLAYLLWEGRLPESFVAEGDLRELRIASRELRSATDERSDLMRRLRSHLAQLGIGLGKNAWSSEQGRARTAATIERTRIEQGMRGQAVARLWQRIQVMDQEVAHWSEQVKMLSKKFDEVALLEKMLPGVGAVIAAAMWSELGDPGRYRSAKAYAKATGLTPGYRESGGRLRKKMITREGSAHVRWALTRAIVSCQRCTRDPAGLAVKRWTQRMSRRKPRKTVYVAAARKLAEGAWRAFALGEAFDLAQAFGGPPRAGRAQAAPRPRRSAADAAAPLTARLDVARHDLRPEGGGHGVPRAMRIRTRTCNPRTRSHV